MPPYILVLLANWPVIPIALMDTIGVVVGVRLYRRRRDWPPLVIAAAFGVRALSSLTRLALYLAGYLTSLNYYETRWGYDPISGALLQQTMNVVVCVGGVATLAAIQAALWVGLTRRPGEVVDTE
jgi:hypothetical protein